MTEATGEQEMQPFYIRQTADVPRGDAARQWFEACMREAKAEGAKHVRFSISPDGCVLLTEAWRERRIPDEGAPRFSYQC